MGDITRDDGESELRGDSLDGSERDRAAGHTTYKKKTDPDKVVRADQENDDLYSDGLEVGDNTPPLGTDGNNGQSS
jgi:hypothetical protein